MKIPLKLFDNNNYNVYTKKRNYLHQISVDKQPLSEGLFISKKWYFLKTYENNLYTSFLIGDKNILLLS